MRQVIAAAVFGAVAMAGVPAWSQQSGTPALSDEFAEVGGQRLHRLRREFLEHPAS